MPVCVLWLQGTCVSSLESVEMLFKFIAPLVQEGEDDDDMDEEVRGAAGRHLTWLRSLTATFNPFKALQERR